MRSILGRRGLDELAADGDSAAPKPQDVGMAPTGALAAKEVEVHVDPDLGLPRVARVMSGARSRLAGCDVLLIELRQRKPPLRVGAQPLGGRSAARQARR